MPTATVSAKGWIVIPREIRRRYGLKRGDKVDVVDAGGVITIVPTEKDPIEALFGVFAEGPSLTEGLLADRREEREGEERGLPPAPEDR